MKDTDVNISPYQKHYILLLSLADNKREDETAARWLGLNSLFSMWELRQQKKDQVSEQVTMWAQLSIFQIWNLHKRRQAAIIPAVKGIRSFGLYHMTVNDSIINKAKVISDLQFSHHIPEAICYCYKYMKCRSDCTLGRADKSAFCNRVMLAYVCW